MSGKKTGLAAAVEELLNDPAQQDMMIEEQLALLPAPTPERIGERGEGKRGPGRPRGAKNKSTSDWAAYIQANYQSPLLFLAEAYSRPAEQLAAELGCSAVDAFKIQLICAKEVAPYVHSKMPTAEGDQEDQAIPLNIFVSEQTAAQAGVRQLADYSGEEVEVIDDDDASENAGKSEG